MDLMQMQQRTASVLPPANAAADVLPGSSAVSDSSDNHFSRALESALGLDQHLEPELNPAPQADPQTSLSTGAETERQDMPLDNSFLPATVPVIMLPPAAAVSAPMVAVGSVVENAAEGALQGEGPELLTNAMLLLKSRGMAADQNPSLLPALPRVASSASLMPVTPLNAQVMLPVPEAPVLSAALVASSSISNRMGAGAAADPGRMAVDSPLQAFTMTALSDDNIGLSTSAIFNAQPGAVSNAPALAGSPTINTPLGASGWGQELGGRVQWMVTQGIQAAALHINPPHLGPVEVRIVMDQDQASISFSAPHMVTRDALEASLPRLRDMLNDNGVNLANVNVSSNAFTGQREQPPGSAAMQQRFSAMDDALNDVSSPQPQSRAINGLVDYYV